MKKMLGKGEIMPMAVFAQGDLPAIVWDEKESKPFFAFQKRKLETNSPKMINMLTKYGYQRDLEAEEILKGKLSAEKRSRLVKVDDSLSASALAAVKKELIPTDDFNAQFEEPAPKRVRLNRELKENSSDK